MARKANKKHITENEIADEFLLFEKEIYLVMKNEPSKYRYNLIQQVFDQLGFMKRFIGKALYYVPYCSEDWGIKLRMLNEAYSEMGALRLSLCQFVRLKIMTQETLARLDLQYNIVETNFKRLLAALAIKAKGSDIDGCAHNTEPDMIRTCDCRTKGGFDG